MALKVVVTGLRNDAEERHTFTLLDRYDETRGISAMMRTTGFSLAITGYLQASGAIEETGVRPAFQSMPYEPYVRALRERGIDIVESTQ